MQASVPSYRASADGVWMTLQVDDRGVGAQLSVQVSGVPAHEHCRLLVVARDGSRTVVGGGWTADYEGSARYAAVSPVPLGQLGRIILSGEGRPAAARHRNLTAAGAWVIAAGAGLGVVGSWREAEPS